MTRPAMFALMLVGIALGLLTIVSIVPIWQFQLGNRP